jgi:dinuclear metal center YbgI/SA1388 family protein
MMKLSEVGDWLETCVPQKYAEGWDNVGWMVGPLSEELSGVLLSVDVTREVLETAIERDLNLVLAHHPLIFESIDGVVEGRPVDDLIARALRERIGIYSAHTNADSMPGGLNDVVADRIDLNDTEPLAPLDVDDRAGLGRIGHLDEPVSLSDLETSLIERLNLTHARSLGDPGTTVRTVALCTGSGGDFINRELARRADLYITGDVGHHEALEARELGLPLIMLDHHEMETVFLSFARVLWEEQYGERFDCESFTREYPYRHLKGENSSGD